MSGSIRLGDDAGQWPMAVNRRRGEVGAVIDGRGRVLCLTLGAMAELEDAFAAEDVGALVQRLGSGRLSARDIVRILGAGLRGAGEAVSDAEVAVMRIEGGTAGAARIVAELLAAAFGEAEGGDADASQADAVEAASAVSLAGRGGPGANP